MTLARVTLELSAWRARNQSPYRNAMSEPADIPPASCPICRKPVVDKFRPFCSKRCADVDLNRWFTGAYVVAGKEEEDEDGAPRDGEGA